jgi:hypothetical protein
MPVEVSDGVIKLTVGSYSKRLYSESFSINA